MRTFISLNKSLRAPAHGWGYIVVAVATASLMAAQLAGPLLHPNNYFFEKGGDGIQSYFATAYYALYDSGLHFSGMNYPYGEHINYPNMQPLLAWLIGFWQRQGIPAARYTIGITNAAALLAVAVTPLVLYAVLRRFRLPVAYAALMAVLIAFLSPQLLRLGAHNSLSYPCFLPALWYCIIRMQQRPQQWRWYAWFVAGSVLIAGIMPYFTAAASFFLLAHVLVLGWQQRRLGLLQWRMVAAALLPLLLYRGWLWFTDPITDRPLNPYGLLVFVSSWKGVFVPYFSPMREAWQALWPLEPTDFEARSYVGIVTGGVLLASVIWGLVRLLRHRRLGRWAVPAPLATGLLAGTLLLFYSFGYPLKWAWFSWFTDHSGPLKQFRALGRFAWPFYYVASVYAAYCLFRFWHHYRRRAPVLALLGLGLSVGVWGLEAWVNFATKSADISDSTGAETFLDPAAPMTQMWSWSTRRPADFQAIMPLPYYNIGSDKLDLAGSPNSIFNAEHLACATGLPLLSTYVSRPSVGRMLEHVQLLSSALIPKTLLQKFPSNKPLLLLVSPAAMTPAELRLIGLAKPLGLTTADYTLYELPLSALGATELARAQTEAAARLPTMAKRPNGLQATTGKGVLYESFDHSADQRSRLGKGGAFYAAPQQFSTLYDGPLPLPADSGSYEASVWINAKTAYGCGNMQVKLYNAGGQLLSHQVADGRLATEIDGDWVRVAVPFRRPAAATRVEVLYDSRDLLADDLLLRPLDTEVYHFVQHQGRKRLARNTYLLDY